MSPCLRDRLKSVLVLQQMVYFFCHDGTGELKFSYVTTLGIETPLKDCAGVTVDEDGFLGFLIKCGALDLQKSGLFYHLDHSKLGPTNHCLLITGGGSSIDILYNDLF